MNLINELLGRGIGVSVLHMVHRSPTLQKNSRMRFDWENPIKMGGLEFPLVRGDWGDYPHYPKINSGTQDLGKKGTQKKNWL